MASIEQLRELAERLEKATGQSDEINLALSLAFDGWEEDVNNVWNEHGCYMGSPKPGSGHFAGINARYYTSSIDAARALVERLLPGWEWVVGTNVKDGERVFTALLHEKFGTVNDYPAEATTPSLAILRALVAAMIDQAEAA